MLSEFYEASETNEANEAGEANEASESIEAGEANEANTHQLIFFQSFSPLQKDLTYLLTKILEKKGWPPSPRVTALGEALIYSNCC